MEQILPYGSSGEQTCQHRRLGFRPPGLGDSKILACKPPGLWPFVGAALANQCPPTLSPAARGFYLSLGSHQAKPETRMWVHGVSWGGAPRRQG